MRSYRQVLSTQYASVLYACISYMHSTYVRGEHKTKLINCLGGESRKRVILIAAPIHAARKLANYDPVRRVPASMNAIVDAEK
jgi:hypothetical protein